MPTMKFKNAKGVQAGIGNAIWSFLRRAKDANRDVMRYRKLHEGGNRWAHDDWMAALSARRNWIQAARTLRDCTYNDVPVHIVGERRYQRIVQKAA